MVVRQLAVDENYMTSERMNSYASSVNLAQDVSVSQREANDRFFKGRERSVSISSQATVVPEIEQVFLRANDLVPWKRSIVRDSVRNQLMDRHSSIEKAD